MLFCIIYLLFYYPKYVQTRATITKRDCKKPYMYENGKRQFCTYSIKFTDNKNKEYKSKIELDVNVNNKNLGKTINIEYDPQNPKLSIREPFIFSKNMRIIISLIIFVISVGTSIFYYLYRKNPIICGIAAIDTIFNNNLNM